MAFIALVAFGSILLALPIMLSWALAATVIYCLARSRGYPDLLEHKRVGDCTTASHKARSVAFSAAKLWCTGFNAFVFSRASRDILAPGRRGWRRLARIGVLGAGLTFFGVAMSEHLLRRAGLSGRQLLQVSMVGACLNVPYRLLLSAAFTQGLWELARALQSTAPLV
ncbi:MAG TPA: hypothetical protein VJB57_10640 [Dehalococcoidia bacterium]|nr:hypothetical protein [Dehalococcoidia bacterium]